eukprot:GHVR01166339.1.p1 GENE.GHVR01166339.1~~GHVR01166339.1.p1  ORF type:complete len:334 (+),score=71.26 GHVR01166339.1:166-1167(+)
MAALDEFVSVKEDYVNNNSKDLQMAAFLGALKCKGETASEISFFVEGIQSKATNTLTHLNNKPLVDIVGTGGDGFHTVNISTGSSILAAACGCYVAKHGNRSVSSLCGSADVLECVGVDLQMTSAQCVDTLVNLNICFLYAPVFHPVLACIKDLRRSLGVSTVFNILGPFLNPAKCKHFILGVYDKEMVPRFVNVLREMECNHSLVVHCCGLDEMTPVGPIHVAELKDNIVNTYTFDPLHELNMPRCTIEDLKGGGPELNAKIMKAVLSGEQEGPVANTFILNAGCALYVTGNVPNIKEGCKVGGDILKSGKAGVLLEEWVTLSKSTLLQRIY